MKTLLLVLIVAAVHCVVIGSVILIQGCGTVRDLVSAPAEPVMPPTGTERAKLQPRVPVRPRPVKSWPAQTTMYVVGKGDSLSAIAHRYNVSVAEIVALNGITNPDMIRSGQKLILPGKIDVDTSRLPKKRKRAETPIAGDVYVVKAGDCLSVIAAGCGVTVDDIRNANGLRGDTIFIGQKLIIPGGTIKWRPDVNLDSEPAGSPVSVDSPISRRPVRKEMSPFSTLTYTVEEGEDLYHVASMWGVSVAELMELNGLTDTELKPGQILKLPMME